MKEMQESVSPDHGDEITTPEELFDDYVRYLDAMRKGRALATAEVADGLNEEGISIGEDRLFPPILVLQSPSGLSAERLDQVKHKFNITDEEYAAAKKELDEIWSKINEAPHASSPEEILGFILRRIRNRLEEAKNTELFPGWERPCKHHDRVLRDNKAIARWHELVFEFRKTHPQYRASEFPRYAEYAPKSMQESMELTRIRIAERKREEAEREKKSAGNTDTP